jgi:acetyltransferase-like isoleucine patch superfamily enzyme
MKNFPKQFLRHLFKIIITKSKIFWRVGWLKYSGKNNYWRLAAWFASWDTMPYHGRAFLADLTTNGFIASNVAISHPYLYICKYVYIGDKVVISHAIGGGSIKLRDRVRLYGNTFLETGSKGNIIIGEGTHVQPGCHIHAFLANIIIGKNVEIASDCGFFCYDHGTSLDNIIMNQMLKTKGDICISDGVWIGYRVTVLQGVKIGEGAVIAAGSVVVHDIPENAIAAGIPAKIIKFRKISNLE